jgi:CHRD domain/PEP-CTERM motif
MSIRSWITGGLLSMAIVLPVAAHPVSFVGSLSSAGEANPSAGTGLVSLVFDDDAFTMSLHVSFSGLYDLTTASHIHCCTALADAGNAGVATPVPTFPGFPLGVTSGTYDRLFDMTQASSWNPAFITANGGTTGSAFAALATGLNSGKAYLNIHSKFGPGGEIRGFLHAAPVPEPATWLSMGAGLALLAWARRRTV